MEKEVVELLVEGGKAVPSASLGQKLAIHKLNVSEILKQINEKTSEYKGIQVPVRLIIDKKTKEYEIVVSAPPVSSLIKKELGIEVAKITEEEKSAGKTSIGNLSIEQIVKIAKLKKEELLAKDLKSAAKQIVGSCVSMKGVGITIENKSPKEILKEIDEGKFDQFFKE